MSGIYDNEGEWDHDEIRFIINEHRLGIYAGRHVSDAGYYLAVTYEGEPLCEILPSDSPFHVRVSYPGGEPYRVVRRASEILVRIDELIDELIAERKATPPEPEPRVEVKPKWSVRIDSLGPWTDGDGGRAFAELLIELRKLVEKTSYSSGAEGLYAWLDAHGAGGER